MKNSKKQSFILTSAAGCLISFILFLLVNNFERENLSRKFLYDSTLRINAVNSIIESDMKTLMGLRNFFYGSNFVDRDEFTDYVSSFLASEMAISSMGWLPRVDKNTIDEYNYLYSDNHYRGDFQISPSLSDQKVFYPLTYIEPYSGNNQTFGKDYSPIDISSVIDYSSIPIGQGVTLLPPSLVTYFSPEQPSLIMILPVLNAKGFIDTKKMNSENMRGFVFSVLSIEKILDISLKTLNKLEIKTSIAPSTFIDDSDFLQKTYLHNSDTNWIVYCEADSLYKKNNRSNHSYVILLFSLICTCIATVFTYRNNQYRRKIEKMVEQKSRELLISRKRLDLAVETGELGCWELNFITGEITANSQLSEMTGFKTNKINNLETFFNMIHEDDRAEVVTRFKQHISGKSLFFESEHRVRTRNNHWLWILTKGQIVERDEEGNPLQLSGIQMDISKMKNMQSILFEEAAIDELTGVYNKRYFQTRLNELMEKCKRQNGVFSIALVDIDLFKHVNETYGHKAGDFILKEFAAYLRTSLRTYNFIGRIEGEKFEIVFENESLDSVHRIMDRIRKNLEDRNLLYKDSPITISFSTGVSSFSEIFWQGGNEEQL
ncbi:MAG: diguanylate cyclase, partial [Spirochaetaceae bacterium]|nr:diguanylate cyclase [Spirochaetaceae bacterium]